MRLLFVFVFLSSLAFGQSKKKQIESLNKSLDSLNYVLEIERKSYNEQINKANQNLQEANKKSADRITELNRKLEELNFQINTLKSKQTDLTKNNNLLNDSIKNILKIKKKNSSLPKIKFNWSYVKKREKVSYKGSSDEIKVDFFINGKLIDSFNCIGEPYSTETDSSVIYITPNTGGEKSIYGLYNNDYEITLVFSFMLGGDEYPPLWIKRYLNDGDNWIKCFCFGEECEKSWTNNCGREY